MPERGQSPPPERSSGKQMHDVPASGKGTDDASHKEDINKEALEHLTSNPRGPMEDEVERKFAKTAKPNV
ncbi:uncharacterized protein THITE_2142287 [Thermothielavioides terrestris NRRL 8126]|uniref:Uncharacterized protein n=2 Tax=Thermothielavioides terrestris TaxID=2587410 RepID=G2QT44_THETT|nr:uncharacterized protein THITE_2142287 [Thermothielavioides terrestris NRRL 8126]AEO64370.1 hypothetical protein THITE_2142287 [Thermothielavioides terrestris NRRL 8126]